MIRFKALLACVLMSVSAFPAQAGLFCHRNTTRVRYTYTRRYTTPACATSPTYRYVYPAPRAAPQSCPGGVCPVPRASIAPTNVGFFLAALNEWRSRHGRPPAVWDSRLAAAAATNNGVHSPGSAAGGSQTWAGSYNLMSALQMWENSPSHASILLNANYVGASLCSTGATCNAL